MSEETNQTCGNCRFWAGTDTRQNGQVSFAECRRHAPQFTRGTLLHFSDERRLEVYARDETESDRAVWPETGAFEWCGEWAELPASPGPLETMPSDTHGDGGGA